MESEHRTPDTHTQDPAIDDSSRSHPVEQSIWDAWRTGVLGFGLASMVVFGSWAFLGKWFYGTLGEIGAYLAWMVIYLGIGCESMRGLIPGTRQRVRFFKVFSLSFAVWDLC